jgi:hypothetical protein
MKKLMALAVAGGAMLAFQGASASPAAAFGWCGWRAAPVLSYRPVCGCRVATYRVAKKRVRARAKPMK